MQHSRLLLGAYALVLVVSSAVPGANTIPVAAAAVSDRDGDGVPDALDACRATPPRAQIIARGCAPMDIVRTPGVFVEPVLAATAAAQKAVAREAGLVDVRRALDDATARIQDARQVMGEQGHVCEAQAAFDRGVLSLDTAYQSTTRFASQVGNAAATEEESGTALVATRTKVRPLEAALSSARQGQAAFQAVCAAVAGPISIAATMSRTVDAQGMVVLSDSRTLALPGGRLGTLAEGVRGTMSGVSFRDGTGVALDIRPDHPQATVSTGAPKAECMGVRILPFQEGLADDSNVGSLIEHNLAGYREENGSMHFLEKRSRLIAHSSICSEWQPNDDGRSFTRHSLELVLQNYTDMNGNPVGNMTSMASDLVPSDPPVEFPWTGDNDFVKQLVVFERTQTCTRPTALGIRDCTAPAIVSSQSFWLTLKDPGAYCSANYAQTMFPIEDYDYWSQRATRVDTTTLDPAVEAGVTQPAFEAEAYRYPDGKQAGVKPLTTGDTFAIFRDDPFYDSTNQDLLFVDLYATQGVNHASGLRWPRVTGVRNLRAFRYSCQTPHLVKDAVFVSDKFFEQPSYDRLPWAGGVTWVLAQGNNSAFSHAGVNAYDFSMPAETEIRAARGGVVVDAGGWRSLNCNPSAGCNSAVACADTVPDALNPCMPNYVAIKHQDDSITYYLHMRKDGVLVTSGDIVKRGDVVAKVGTTGYSTGPHLHFQSWTDAGLNSVICFERMYLGKKEPCHVPVEYEWLLSTNLS